MKVITFCAYFEPEIAASMYLTMNLLEEMANNNIEVDVYVPTPTRGVTKEIIDKYKKIKYEEMYNGKVKVHRFFMIQERKNTLARAFRYFILNAVFFIKGLKSDADVMFIDSTPPTQGLLAGFLKKIKHIPMVYNLQDVFPDSLVHANMTTEGSVLWRIGRKMEDFTYNNADKIIAISNDMKINIMDKGVNENKIVIVPNWVDTDKVHVVNRENNILFDKYNLDRGKFYVTYCGNIGHSQNISYVVNAAKALRELYPEINFVVIGDGAEKSRLETVVEKEKLSNLILLPFQEYDYIDQVFSLGDVGLIISKAGTAQNSVPSKTWSYMAAETPILASFDKKSELENIITSADCGICIEPDNENLFIDTIVDIYKGTLKNKGINGREYILKNMGRKECTKKYVDTILDISEV